jgi:hypothetical protein
MQPTLDIAYNSRQQNGPLGVGWSLQGLSSISRCKRDFARDNGYNVPIQFKQTDAFCLDGQRLVAIGTVNNNGTGPYQYGAPGTLYHTEEERFIQVVNGPVDDQGQPWWFEVDYKDGRKFLYGTTQDSRLEGVQSGTTKILKWALAELRDPFGNNMTVQYNSNWMDDCGSLNEQLPVSTQYTGTVENSLQPLTPLRTVNFTYTCTKRTSGFVSGLEIDSAHVLQSIVLLAPTTASPNQAIKSYNLTYQVSPASGRSLLSQILECDGESTPFCLPPTASST